jgi:hypothetical protein
VIRVSQADHSPDHLMDQQRLSVDAEAQADNIVINTAVSARLENNEAAKRGMARTGL